MTVSKQSEPLEAIVTSRVLQRMLGSQMYDVAKYHLSHRYHIRLDEGKQKLFNLEDLKIALYALFGKGAANIVMIEIEAELDKLESK